MVQYKDKLYKPNSNRQYRSAIFVSDEEQRKIAKWIVKELQISMEGSQTIHVDIESVGPFYKAEEYHQNYLSKRF